MSEQSVMDVEHTYIHLSPNRCVVFEWCITPKGKLMLNVWNVHWPTCRLVKGACNVCCGATMIHYIDQMIRFDTFFVWFVYDHNFFTGIFMFLRYGCISSVWNVTDLLVNVYASNLPIILVNNSCIAKMIYEFSLSDSTSIKICDFRNQTTCMELKHYNNPVLTNTSF